MRLLLASVILGGCKAPCGDVRHTESPHTIELSGLSGARVAYTAAGRTQSAAVSDGLALLTGLPPLTEVGYQLLDADDAMVCQEAVMSWNLPPGLPQITVTETQREQINPDQVLLGTIIGSDGGGRTVQTITYVE